MRVFIYNKKCTTAQLISRLHINYKYIISSTNFEFVCRLFHFSTCIFDLQSSWHVCFDDEALESVLTAPEGLLICMTTYENIIEINITHLTDSQINAQSDWLHRSALKMTSAAISRENSRMEIVLFERSSSGFS